ncbi:733_t:CDS:10 [Ambispora leptoticha]|uniref:733_t:CDS:1 n=1 Tax=Ambispora leptoticha TaxID=144679 RepID=A0A9N9G1P3_9GLOM|nr:733_t:CDS:10 [Ambispora leptoticha]
MSSHVLTSQNGESSSNDIHVTSRGPAILLIKFIQFSVLKDINRNPFSLSLPKTKLEFSIDDENNQRCMTTETKFKKKDPTVWSEHLTFELSPPIKDILSLYVRCYNMSKKGDDGLFGEAKVKLSTFKGHKEKARLTLEKNEESVGDLFFDIYFLSGSPPKDADLNLRNVSSSNDKIGGVLLLKEITCKDMSKKGPLEFILNNNEAEAHLTKKYWKMSSDSQLTGFTKAKFEIKSKDANTWRSLMQSGTIKSGNVPFVEDGFDEAGYINFELSFHGLTTFKQIQENIQEVTQTSISETRKPPINTEQNTKEQNGKNKTSQNGKARTSTLQQTQINTNIVNAKNDQNQNNKDSVQSDFGQQMNTPQFTKEQNGDETSNQITEVKQTQIDHNIADAEKDHNESIDVNDQNNSSVQNDFEQMITKVEQNRDNKDNKTKLTEVTEVVTSTLENKQTRINNIVNDKNDQNQNNEDFDKSNFEQMNARQSTEVEQNGDNKPSQIESKEEAKPATEVETSTLENKQKTTNDLSDNESQISLTSTNPSLNGNLTLVCLRYIVMYPVENNSPSDRKSSRHKNRIYKGHNIFNLEQVIIKVFERRSSWENERKYLCSLSSKYVVKWEDMEMEINRSLGGFVSVTTDAGENLETNVFIFRDSIARKRILLSISKAIEFLHNEKIAHLDLTPSNIICKPNNVYKIRLCDFESAKKFGDYLQSNFRSCGYSAPEIVQNDTIKVSSAQDIFSLGCIFYFIHTKKYIYDDFSDLIDSTCSDWVRGGDISDTQATNIILRMLNWDPVGRPAIQDVIYSDYFNEFSNTDEVSSEFRSVRSSSTSKKNEL